MIQTTDHFLLYFVLVGAGQSSFSEYNKKNIFLQWTTSKID